jgi:hypothetical protein
VDGGVAVAVGALELRRRTTSTVAAGGDSSYPVTGGACRALRIRVSV